MDLTCHAVHRHCYISPLLSQARQRQAYHNNYRCQGHSSECREVFLLQELITGGK